MTIDTEKLRALLAALHDKNHPNAAEVDWHRVAVAAVNALPELLDALATAEAERLTLARALPRCSVPTCTSKAVVNARVDGRTPHNPGPAYRAWFCVECIAARPHTSECVSATWDVDLAARIVAEADAAAAGKETT